MSRVDNFYRIVALIYPSFNFYFFVRLFNHSFKIYIKKIGKKYAHTRSFYL